MPAENSQEGGKGQDGTMPEAGQAVIRLFLIDTAVQALAIMVKRFAKQRAIHEVEGDVESTTGIRVTRRERATSIAASRLATRSAPAALVIGGGVAMVLWYRYAKNKRDERRASAQLTEAKNVAGRAESPELDDQA